jgi:alcohol dehydrogenase
MTVCVEKFACVGPIQTQVYLGIGAHKNLLNILGNISNRPDQEILFLCDRALVPTEFFKSIEGILKENGSPFDLFAEIDAEPSDTIVEKVYERCKKNKPSLILAVGGGSAIDIGKAVGILIPHGGSIYDYEGVEKYKGSRLPLVAIPTTAGTGSEVTGSCIITNTRKGVKMSITHSTLNPANIAILDPLSLVTLPAAPAACAGVDALTHALESYTNLNSNLITDALNLQAIELISKNIRQFVSNRSNLDAGLKMLCAASLAGLGFTNTGLGNVHCMSRFVGTFFHVAHGLATAVCLPVVAEFNLLANPEKFARVSEVMGENIAGLTTMEAGRKGIETIRQLNRDLGIPSRLRDLGVKEEKIPEMAELCFKANYNTRNPRYTTVNDFVSLFKRAF